MSLKISLFQSIEKGFIPFAIINYFRSINTQSNDILGKSIIIFDRIKKKLASGFDSGFF